MERVALISDTHIPSRASSIPERVRDEVRESDHTVHAGDFTSPDVVQEVEELADSNLTAVTGNMDPSLDLPATATLEVEDVAFVVTHGRGSKKGYAERVAETAEHEASDADVVVGVAGHTHEVVDTTVGETRVLNPGSCTGAPPAERTTMMVAEVDGGDVDVTVLEI